MVQQANKKLQVVVVFVAVAVVVLGGCEDVAITTARQRHSPELEVIHI